MATGNLEGGNRNVVYLDRDSSCFCVIGIVFRRRSITYCYIVCVGYSKLLEEILKGIDPNLAVTTFSIPEHRRNIVRIDDEKYNIHI